MRRNGSIPLGQHSHSVHSTLAEGGDKPKLLYLAGMEMTSPFSPEDQTHQGGPYTQLVRLTNSRNWPPLLHANSFSISRRLGISS